MTQQSRAAHDWREISTLAPADEYISDYQVSLGLKPRPRRIWWCSLCGAVKNGPHAEQASWGWYVYLQVGVQDHAESKTDPPCKGRSP